MSALIEETRACRNLPSRTSTTCKRSFGRTSSSASVPYLSIDWPQWLMVCASFSIFSEKTRPRDHPRSIGWELVATGLALAIDAGQRCRRSSISGRDSAPGFPPRIDSACLSPRRVGSCDRRSRQTTPGSSAGIPEPRTREWTQRRHSARDSGSRPRGHMAPGIWEAGVLCRVTSVRGLDRAGCRGEHVEP
jgi:hypothetical protein